MLLFLKILKIIYKEWLISMDVVKLGACSGDKRARGKPISSFKEIGTKKEVNWLWVYPKKEKNTSARSAVTK